jgi:tetratricopeptide (TPR) repeat protein
MEEVERGLEAYPLVSGVAGKRILLLLIFMGCLVAAYLPLTEVRDARPPQARLGFFPPAPVIKALSADQYQFLSHVISLECLFYFGTLTEEERPVPAWNRLYEALYTASRLDPYNMDTYYFAQAVLPWDAGMIHQAVDLMEYGFAHRTWDWYLPFFLSFDYAFFLKDYSKAGEYMARAATLNPQPWFSTLASRYFYEGGRTALALAYLKEMIATAGNETVRQHLMVRAEAFERILEIEEAISVYKGRFHRLPRELRELVRAGLMEHIPEDPYGGAFYLDQEGRVRTTSKLAFGRGSHGTHQN